MVKKRYFFIISVLIHGVLAYSISPSLRTHGNIQHYFLVTLQSHPQESRALPERIKTSPYQIKKKKGIPTTHKTTKVENLSPGPFLLHSPPPKYPKNAKANGQEAVFCVKILVAPSGDIEKIDIKTIKGEIDLFEEEIRNTINSWKFSPHIERISFEIPISFLLDQ